MELPPEPHSPPGSNSVRRHHTISSSSRPARAAARQPISEDQAWDLEDEYVADDWVGPVGAVGEKTNLHRQASLPTKYSRHAYRHGQPDQPVNSLSAIQAAHGIDVDAEEEDWEQGREMMRGWMQGEEDEGPIGDDNSAQDPTSPLSPQFHPDVSQQGGVRRHQSLNYAPRHQRKLELEGVRRAGTVSNKTGRPRNYDHTPSPPSEERVAEVEPEDEHLPYDAPAYPQTPPSRSPWNSAKEYRGGNVAPGSTNTSAGLDDVQRALASLNMSSPNAIGQRLPETQTTMPGSGAPHISQPAQLGPRFNNNPGYANNNAGYSPSQQAAINQARKLQLVTDLQQPELPDGPVSASAFMPPIGVAPPTRSGATSRNDDRALTASGSTWDQKDRALAPRTSNSNLSYAYNGAGNSGYTQVPPMPAIPPQYLNQTNPPRMGVVGNYNIAQPSPMPQAQHSALLGGTQVSGVPAPAMLSSPIDVPTLIATKGYNPTNFEIRPEFARYFVIKSYTEDDVHKSLKYEIWSSTDPGNKRLDKAFKETAGRGPIYLFFSVNGSGHFCGMAEMLTPVDYTRSSTVWASDKWKGVFKVRWIFVRDVPNSSLRHIRLNNTQERKPVTNSRDTQELLPDAGHEMLRIFFTHPARTSLLQDFAYYELQTLQKMNTGPSPSPSPQPQMPVQQQGSGFGMANQGYATQHLQMPQMMPMQLGAGYSHPHAIQSVMRQPSPVPVVGPGYMAGPPSNAF